MPLIFWIGLSIVIVISVIDIYLAYKYGFAGTISWWILTNSVQYPILPAAVMFIVGAFIGHYWWNMQTLILIPTGALMGHFWWDQELNVNVIGGTTEPTKRPSGRSKTISKR